MIQLSQIKDRKQREKFRQAAGQPVVAKAVIRATTDEAKLNRTERAWLQVLGAMGKFAKIRVQSITLKIGHDTRYTADFQTTGHDGVVTFWEVKGFYRDDARVKMQVVARQFSEFKFMLVYKKGKGWITEEVKP